MIDVALLGTGGMMPLPHRWLSSLLVRVNETLILFDCGEGTQIAWRQMGWSLRRLAVIAISHTHGDHIAGLPGLLHAVANTGRTETLTILGPVGLAHVVHGLRVIAPVLPFSVEVVELVDGEQFPLPNGLLGSCVAGQHALPVLAYRLDLVRQPQFRPDRARELGLPVTTWGRLQAGEVVEWEGQVIQPQMVQGGKRPGLALAFVTDTRPTPAIASLIAGVDLLVCEGTYGSDDDLPKAERNAHMTYREAATLAAEAGVRDLWLTHFSPGLEEPQAFAANATAVFPKTTIGHDGLHTTLVFPRSASVLR